MSKLDRDTLEILTGEYVLGLVQGGPRAQLARLIATDPVLQDLVDHWERRLAPMIDLAPNQAPANSVWTMIQRATIEQMVQQRVLPPEPDPEPEPAAAFNFADLLPDAVSPMKAEALPLPTPDFPPPPQSPSPPPSSPTPAVPKPGLWSNAGLWRGVAGLSLALAAVTAAALWLQPAPPPAPPAREPAGGQKLAVLVDQQRTASWLMRTDTAGQRLTINPVRPLPPPDGQSYVLWLVVDPDLPPVNLGRLPPAGRIIDALPGLFTQASQIGISLDSAQDITQAALPQLANMDYLGAIVQLEAPSP